MRAREILSRIGAEEIVAFLKNSYLSKKLQATEVFEFEKDAILSGSRTTVYKDKHSPLCVIVHRGTSSVTDVGTDVLAAIGLFRWSRRLHDASIVHKYARRKYGRRNIVTLGHSLGALIAEKLGNQGKYVITYNKPVTLTAMFETLQKQQTDIRAKHDILSTLSSFQLARPNHRIVIPSPLFQPLKAHSVAPLEEHGVDVTALLRQESASGSGDSVPSSMSSESD